MINFELEFYEGLLIFPNAPMIRLVPHKLIAFGFSLRMTVTKG